MGEDESIRGKNSVHLVNPDTYRFELFDLKNKVQFHFAAVILDHSGLKRREQYEDNIVQGSPLSGMQMGYSWIGASDLPKIEERFLSDFEAKSERCNDFAQKGFYSQPLTIFSREYGVPSINGEVVLSRGDVSKGEPLITLETFWAPLLEDYYGIHSQVTTSTLYQEPSEKIEFYGVGPSDQPVMEREHVSLYRTMGGVAIIDEKKREHHYIIGEGQGRAYIRTVDNLADLPIQDVPGAFEICSLGGKGAFDQDSGGAQGPMYGAISHLRACMTDFDSEERLRILLNSAYHGCMPEAGKLRRPEERMSSTKVEPAPIDISELTVIQPPSLG